MTAFEIKVTVDLLDLPGAIHDLADALRGSSDVQAPMTVATPAIVNTPAPEPAPVTPVAPMPEPVPVTAPAAPVAPAPTPAPEPAPVQQAAPAPAKEYTFKQISTAGAKLCSDQTKMNQLIDLLNSKYGAPAITMIDKSRFPELAEDLIKLGAVIEEE